MSDLEKEYETADEDDFNGDIESEYVDDESLMESFEEEEVAPPAKVTPPAHPKKQNGAKREEPVKKKNNIVNIVLIGLIFIILIVGGGFIYLKMNARPQMSLRQIQPLSAQQIQQAQQAQPLQTVQPVQPVQQAQPLQTAQPVQPVQQAQSFQTVPPATVTDAHTVPSSASMMDSKMAEVFQTIEKLTNILESVQKKQIITDQKQQEIIKTMVHYQSRIDKSDQDSVASVKANTLTHEIEELKSSVERRDVLIKKQEGQIADLQAEIKDLAGKNDWLRHLNSQQKHEIMALKGEPEEENQQGKLSEIAADKKEPQSADLKNFLSSWRLAGLSSDFVVFTDKAGRPMQMLVGDSWRGLKVLNIDAAQNYVETSSGKIYYQN